MSNKEIDQIVQRSITNREYLKGRETRFYLLTIKYDENLYGVKLLDNHKEIESENIPGRLDAAKTASMKMLQHHYPDAMISDITLVHFKVDRPNGVLWQKDSSDVVLNLFTKLKTSATGTANDAYLQGGKSKSMKKTVTKNLILYGPPGTGKTYNVIIRR